MESWDGERRDASAPLCSVTCCFFFFFFFLMRFYSLHVWALQDCTKLVVGWCHKDVVWKSSVLDQYVRESLIEAW
jgi:hypothetical protein